MLKLLRRLFLLPFQLLPLIATVAAIGLYIRTESVDPGPYAERIVRAVEGEVGQSVRINGGVDIEFAWPPRLVLRDVEVRNPDWAGERNMLQVRRIEAELDPLELLFGEVSAPTTRFVDARIVLATNSQGDSNWGPNGAEGPGGVLSRAMSALGSETTQLAGGEIVLTDAGGGTTVVPLGGATVVSRRAAAGRGATSGDRGNPCPDG